jgi:L-ascorbate metabolism protein UlaG (beta-lactamase superfamily)
MTRLLPLFILASLSFGINSKTITEISYVGVPGYDLALGQVLEWSKASVEHNEPNIRSAIKPLPGLRIRWLGTFGYEISDAQTTILIDPFISRPKLTELLKPIVIDTSAVQRYLLSTIDLDKLAAILVTHSHYDHLQDVPYILAQYPDATNRPLVVGDPNTSRIINGYQDNSGIDWVDRKGGLDDSHINVLNLDNNDPMIEIGTFGRFSVTAFKGQHPRYDYIPWRGPKGSIMDKPPYNCWDYKLYNKQSIGYLVETNGLRIYFSDSPLVINPELIGQVDILIQTITTRAKNNIGSCLSELKPEYYIPAHYDNFFKPLSVFNKFDPVIGLDLLEKRSDSPKPSLIEYSRYNEFFTEFETQYVPQALESKKLDRRPRLRVLKLLYYYSLESLITK